MLLVGCVDKWRLVFQQAWGFYPASAAVLPHTFQMLVCWLVYQPAWMMISVRCMAIAQSSSLACPVSWGPDIADQPLLPFCPVCCVVLFQPCLCHISLLHASFHLRFGRPLVFLGKCPHLTFFSLYLRLFHPHHLAVPLQSFFCHFLGRLPHPCCPSNVFISDLIPPCHSAHPSQHPHHRLLFNNNSKFIVPHLLGLTNILIQLFIHLHRSRLSTTYPLCIVTSRYYEHQYNS